jgi:hypothetical protein
MLEAIGSYLHPSMLSTSNPASMIPSTAIIQFSRHILTAIYRWKRSVNAGNVRAMTSEHRPKMLNA